VLGGESGCGWEDVGGEDGGLVVGRDGEDGESSSSLRISNHYTIRDPFIRVMSPLDFKRVDAPVSHRST
jgi:hypothetical protein